MLVYILGRRHSHRGNLPKICRLFQSMTISEYWCSMLFLGWYRFSFISSSTQYCIQLSVKKASSKSENWPMPPVPCCESWSGIRDWTFLRRPHVTEGLGHERGIFWATDRRGSAYRCITALFPDSCRQALRNIWLTGSISETIWELCWSERSGIHTSWRQ